MTSAHKDMIQKYFYEGEDYKGMKKSSVLIVEAMIKELDSDRINPNTKHYIPCASEVTVLIGQMSTCRKKHAK